MAKQLAKRAPKRLLNLVYEARPAAVNICSLPQTAIIADKNYDYHPFHIPIRRRLAAFDPKKLHWNVSVAKDVSKSAYIRDWSVRRVRHAFKQELRRLGWDPDGRWIGPNGVKDEARKPDLSGAIKMWVVKDPFALTATPEEVKGEVQRAVNKLLQKQEEWKRDGSTQPHWKGPHQKSNRGSGNAGRAKHSKANQKPARRNDGKG